jgi:tRNA threonylcarbamoyladenosine biosynthesis protein TsaB
MGPRLLALDTSTDRLAVGLIVADRQWTASEPGGSLASSRLIAVALELLAGAALPVGDLDAIAYGAGPGAFTGLRSSCAVAQGLALGAAKPVLAIDSLMIVAEDALSQLGASPDELWVAMDARIDEIYAACYRHDANGWRTLCDPALYPVAALAARWNVAPPRVVAGSAIEVFEGRLPFGEARLVPRERDRAHALLVLARRQWDAGATMDAAQALPVYLRDKVALTSAERAAARAAGAAG